MQVPSFRLFVGHFIIMVAVFIFYVYTDHYEALFKVLQSRLKGPIETYYGDVIEGY